ncbi:alpha-2-HS-glycoprotein 2 [Brachyhypopomus gauderio]|uniref:alpha-2-HS-glycoprotein 2 n=1 Tax=Brachyhypopomus gauderio TaxID=698409 RepID=UPI00404280C6
MELSVTAVVLGTLVLGAWAQIAPNVTLPSCSSPEAEAAAQVALEFINGQHTHGYKYALNHIEDIKVITQADGTQTYHMDIEFLETKCHVLDPTPVPQCLIRPKIETAVEADCDVVLSNAAGVMSGVAFKCKTETESNEEICLGCPSLIPFNDTAANQFVTASLDFFNKNQTLNSAFTLFEIGRLSSQIVSGGPKFTAEYAIIETNCTSSDDLCVPLEHTKAHHGFCLAEGVDVMKIDCKIFPPPPAVDPATNATVLTQVPAFHAHTAGPGYKPSIHALTHHKLTPLHDPTASGLLSAESAESTEVVVAAATVPIVKREVMSDKQPADILLAGPQTVPHRCPGKVKFF